MLLLAGLLAGCFPLPDVRPTTAPLELPYRFAPSEVEDRWVWVDGYDEPSTPDHYDRQGTLRWGVDEPIDTVIVAVGGLHGGAGQFAPLARRLVASVPGVEVWAIDRRSNALEDRSVVATALRDGDASLVIDHYLGTEGRAPGFRRPDPERFSFVREWGLNVHLHDLDAVVREAARTAPRVVLLGYSLGASQAAVYTAWEAGSAVQAIDGLVLLDGAPGRTGALGLEEGFRLLGIPVVLPTRQALESGRALPWRSGGAGGTWFARRQGTALLAALDPEATVPPELSAIPMSRLAFAGILFDDQYGALTPLSASLGSVKGADLDGNVTAAIVGGRWGVRAGSVVGVADDADRIEWVRDDPRFERSEIREYLAGWTHPHADVDEWYVPFALLLDLTRLSPDLAGQAGFAPTRSVTVPTLAIGSDRGLLREVEAFRGYAEQRLGSQISVAILQGLTHVDMLSADENPVVPLLGRWVALLPP